MKTIMGREIKPVSLYNLVKRYEFAERQLNESKLNNYQLELLSRKKIEAKDAICEMLLSNIDNVLLKEIY